MLLAHAVLLAEARSYLAALADHATSFDASLEYERVLLQLDWMHGATIAPTTAIPTHDRELLHRIAASAIANLERHGVDRIEVQICSAMLAVAWELDQHHLPS